MIDLTKLLIERTRAFEDSHEIRDALLKLANDKSLTSEQVDFLKETAEHIDGLYAHACQLTRAVRVKPLLLEATLADGINVKDIGLSTRALNCLHATYITTVGDLRRLSKKEILQLSNLGQTTYKEIHEALVRLGVDHA